MHPPHNKKDMATPRSTCVDLGFVSSRNTPSPNDVAVGTARVCRVLKFGEGGDFSLPAEDLSTVPVRARGSLIYDTTTEVPYFSDGTQWLSLGGLGENAFIFSTSLTPDGSNIFNDWAALYAKLQGVSTVPKFVYVDATFGTPAVIPAGSYDLAGVRIQALHLRDGQQDNIRIADGAVLDNAFWWEDVSIDFATGNTVMTLPFSSQTGFTSFSLTRSAFFSTSSTTPPIRVNAAGANIQLNKALLQGFGASGPLITVDAGITLGMNCSGQCVILDDNITGAGTCFLTTDTTLFLDSTTQTIATLTVSYPRTYEKGTPADWAGAATPISYKVAVDRLGAAVAGLLGGAIP